MLVEQLGADGVIRDCTRRRCVDRLDVAYVWQDVADLYTGEVGARPSFSVKKQPREAFGASEHRRRKMPARISGITSEMRMEGGARFAAH